MPTRLAGIRALIALGLAGLLVAGCGSQVPVATDAPGATRVLVTLSPTPATITSSPAASPATSPTATPAPHLTALVPVVNFWSGVSDISSSDLRLLLAGGQTAAFNRVVVEAGTGQALVDSLNLNITSVNEMEPAALFDALKPGVLGLVKIDDLVPSVSALNLDGLSLFGYARLGDLARWPLLIADPGTFDYTTVWTLAGGGDVNLDRSVYQAAIIQGRGVDYPWSGGTSVISRHVCCGDGNNELVEGSATGSPGAFRAVFGGSDLALVNLEGPAPNQFTYHRDGFSFSFDPALLAGLADAGISAVGLANNHIRNAGETGVLETLSNLAAVGLPGAGAGANLAAAVAPVWLTAGGQRIAFLAFDAVQSENWATANRAGAAPLIIGPVVGAIKAAKSAGADLVIVMPHWGTEYTAAVSATQKNEATAMMSAGADIILGSHPHWLSGITLSSGAAGRTAFIAYSLGDLLFDLNHDERTQEGVIVNLTFVGPKLLQVRLVPTLLLHDSQGSILTGAGAVKVLADIERASG